MIQSLLQKLNHPLFSEYRIEVDMLRLDLIHPIISGNKWFKLKFFLEEVRKRNKDGIVTFGGAWSNHIVATAFACKKQGIPCTGIIRGEEPVKHSLSLEDAKEYGMKLCFVSRSEYDQFTTENKPLPDEYENYILVPEGGKGATGRMGAAGILELTDISVYNEIFCAVGTGTTMAGILQSAVNAKINGVMALKIPDTLYNEFESLMMNVNPTAHYELLYSYHFGGYARKTDELISFMNRMYDELQVPTDFVYTAKMMFGFMDLAFKQKFVPGTRICLIHSGGLQGNRSLPKGTLKY